MDKNEQFLQQLRLKFDSKGLLSTTTDLQKNIAKAECSLTQEKYVWYQTRLLLTEIQQMINDFDVAHITTQHDSKTSEVIKSLKITFALAQANQYLQQTNGDELSLLGISGTWTTEQFDTTPEKKSASEIMQMLNNRLHKKLLLLSDFYQPSHPSTGNQLLNAKAAQLHLVVERDKKKIQQTKNEITKLLSQQTNQLHTLQQTYAVALKLLDEVLVKYKLGSQAEADETTVNHLSARAQAFSTKLRLIESELLADTYRPDVVEELSKVKDKLERQIAKVTEDLNKANQAHKACQLAGPEFESIAKDYSQTLKDIEARRWALQELQSSRRKKK